MELNQTFLAQMREATELLQTSGPAAATAAIQRAMQGASGASTADVEKKKPAWSPSMLQPAALLPTSRESWKGSSARQRLEAVEIDAVVDRELDGEGKFLTASCTNHAGTRSYKYQIDPSRVYVAGLSAGGAMAAIMGASYPELYAAVGIHSGLPVGAAHDLPSAFAAMKNGTAKGGTRSASVKPIPVIVFHGDRDVTVHPGNGVQALAQCVEPNQHDVTVEEGKVPHGHHYTRAVQCDRDGRAIAEQWVVHGAGHAWSGGNRNGSYTDPKGPNASREMMRFFNTHTRSGQ